MNDGLRWLLVLGCLCIVSLEAPQDLLQVLEDSSGAYPAQAPSALASAPLAMPSSLRSSAADDDAASIDELTSPSLVFTKLDTAPDPSRSAASVRVIATHPRSEEDDAHEPRDERGEQRAEFTVRR